MDSPPLPRDLFNKLEDNPQRFQRNASPLARLSNVRRDRDEPYVYEPLPAGDYFRCLSLEPGSGNEPLRCSLCTLEIGEATYEALSYVWGSDTRDQRIYCDGYTLDITRNLRDALQRFRSPKHTRELWADSICINQEDDEEKGHQVSNMGRIYSSASCVLIFMGLDPDGHGPKVASLIDDLQDLFEREMKGMVSYDWGSFPHLPLDTTRAPRSDTRWQSLRALLRQPWFERGWVVREAGLAKHSRITWGDGEFHWTGLMWTALWIQGRSISIPALSGSDLGRLAIHTDTYWDRHHRQLRIFFESQPWDSTGLLHYLASGRRLQFKDRRDSIYAFLDLTVKPSNDLTLTADYEVPLQEVFRNFAEEYLHATGDITILRYVVHNTYSLGRDLPSWVPRWIQLEQHDDDELWTWVSASRQNATTYTRPEVIGGRLLKVTGTILDTVGFVSQVLYETTSTPHQVCELWKTIQNWASQVVHDFQFGLTNIVDVILHDPMSIYDEQEWARRKSEYVKEVERIGSMAQDDSEPVVKKHHAELITSMQTSIGRYTNAKRVMVTGQGCGGLAPAAAQRGDIIGKIFGSRSLPEEYVYLLRTTDDSNHYKFVGPAWTYGIIPENTKHKNDTEDAVAQGEFDNQEDPEKDYTTGLHSIFLC